MIDTEAKANAAIQKCLPFTYIKSANFSGQVTGGFSSHWAGAGTPGTPATPTATAVEVNNLTTGAIPFNPEDDTNPFYLLAVELRMNGTNSPILADRLAHVGGMWGTLTTGQTASLSVETAITQGRAKADYTNVRWFLEWYTSTGSTAVTATIEYQDSTNAIRTCTVAIPATTAAGRFIPIIPNAGQVIKNIRYVTLSATTGTAGNFGVTACVPLCQMSPLPVHAAEQGPTLDYTDIGLEQLSPKACLFFYGLQGETTARWNQATLWIGQE